MAARCERVPGLRTETAFLRTEKPFCAPNDSQPTPKNVSDQALVRRCVDFGKKRPRVPARPRKAPPLAAHWLADSRPRIYVQNGRIYAPTHQPQVRGPKTRCGGGEVAHFGA